MRLVRVLTAGVLAAAAFTATPATAFTCNGPTIDTDPVGLPGTLTGQACIEVRVLPTSPVPSVTTAGQVGVEVLGAPRCVGYHRITVGPGGVTYGPTPISLACP